ncbi:hypothetical protein E4U59_006480 [Claviceps monticola]|nr:hypothetical protein E4U59_006480 [Claviceps monticola]
MSEAASPSLAYHEPGIFTIMIQSSLLILLNVINFVLPGLKWLESSVETAIVQLGYLGLLLLVYEGGLSACLKSLRANVWMSMAVAVTGISIPIGLSFVLMRLTNATPSTSLGTTFTVLGTSGLTRSRLGVILTTAAMIEDVVGLVLVQVISNLGKEGASITVSIVIRPLLVSVGFIVLTPLLCLFLVRPLMRRISQVRKRLGPGACSRLLASEHLSLLVHTLILLGTFNLFAAYIAGASVSWWDSTGSDKGESSAANASADGNIIRPSVDEGNKGNQTSSAKATGSKTIKEDSTFSGLQVYEIYFSTPVDRILKPFTFVSIGFSIPITKMLSGDIVWKGFVYAMLMILAKLACGICLVRISMFLPASWKTATESARQILRLKAMPRMGFGREKYAIVARCEHGFLPLEAAAEAHDILSAESDLQDAIFDIDTAPEMTGPEARPEDLEEASVLDKRARQFSKTIALPQSTSGNVNPPPIYLDEVRVEFVMAQKQISKGKGMVTQWYCKSLRLTNGGKVRRRVTVKVYGRPTLATAFLPPRSYTIVEAPQNVPEFIMEVISVPGKGRGQ